MFNMVNACSGSEYVVRKELTGFFKKNFGMLPEESFMWVTSRRINGGEGFTVGTPFVGYVSKYFLVEKDNGRHLINDVEMALLSESKILFEKVESLIGKEDMSIIKSYYLDREGISAIVERTGKTYGVIKKIFGDYHKAFHDVISAKEKEYLDVDGTSVLSLKIGWKPKSLLWNAGIRTVEDLNTCFYTGSTDIGKILNSHQLYVLSDALKNLETA